MMSASLSRLGQITEQYSGLMAAVPDAILFVDSNNNIRECNDRVCDVTGYSRPELEGNSLDILIQKKDRSHKKYFDEFIAGGGEYLPAHSDVQIRKKDGKVIPVRISRSSYMSAEGPMFVAIIYEP